MKKKTRSHLRKTLLCHAAFFKNENHQSPLNSVPKELCNKISNAILESHLPVADLNNSAEDLKKIQEVGQEIEDCFLSPRLKW